jgi:ABC transport system ATP-binding/permease protein
MDRDRQGAQARDELPRRLPVRAAARELAGQEPLGRRAQPAAAGAPVRAAGQRAGARRADPTNDLDIETLELLEELLQSYDGTVFLVSHDRRFLDAVVTSTIAWEGDGRWREYEGGVQDWLVQRERTQALRTAHAVAAPPLPRAEAPQAAKPGGATRKLSKLSYKEQRELDELPVRIEALEAEQAALRDELADGSIYARAHERAALLHARETEIEDELMQLLERWEALSAR